MSGLADGRHRVDAADTGPKGTGLAQYAKDHASSFRRIVAVIKNTDGVLMSLDLKNPAVAGALANAATETDIRQLFHQYGGAY